MLTLRVKAGAAVFSWDEGPMKAQWELRSGMSEEEIMQALASMARFVRAQPAGAEVIDMPLHVVPPLDTPPPPKPLGPVMTWTPAVKPVPLQDSLERAQASGFEPIPPDELED